MKWMEKQIEDGIDKLVKAMSLEEKASRLVHGNPAIPRLGLGAYNWWNEALHGVARAGRATVFPQAIGLAASFDPELIYRVADAISTEARAKYHAAASAGRKGQYRGLTFWTPNVNIFRDPRWGRGQETYGEDPWLTGKLGTAFVRGLQQERQGVLKAAACAKHFAVHSGPEGQRHSFDARVSEQELHGTYLPAFKTLVTEGKVEAVMGAYNRTNGEPCCGSPYLLQKLLRESWGFQGHVVSDCWAIRDFHEHHNVSSGPLESVRMALEAGCDLNCGCTYDHVVEAVRSGLLDEALVDRSVKRLLRTLARLGILNAAKGDTTEKANPWGWLSMEKVDSPAHRNLAREAAESSFVLLKNSGVLPLDDGISSLYVIGPGAFNPSALMGNYYGLNGRIVTFLEGIVNRVPESASIDYRSGTLLEGEKPNPVDWALFEAADAEVCIACFGLDNSLEGEEGDAVASPHLGDREHIELPPGQLDYLRRLRKRCRKLVVVLTSGSALAVPELHEMADAIIMAWYPGEEGGTALASMLFGDSAPSGKLPVTFYRSTEDLPPYEDYSMKERTYRFFTGETLYPFGFGLSYTRFTFSEMVQTPSGEGGALTVKATVQNIGERAGTVVAQLYLQPPESGDGLPLFELRGVSKQHLLPGEKRYLCFTLQEQDFTLFDQQGRPFVPRGEWTVHIGDSLPVPRSIELGASEGVLKGVVV